MSTRRLFIAVFAATLAGAGAVAQAADPPSASTGGATSITYTAAVLNGSVNPRGLPTSYFFQYGRTASYTASTNTVAVGSGTKGVAAAAYVTGLAPATTFHYRIVASNALGTAVGGDHTFKTAKLPLSLAIAAFPNPVTFGSPVTITGTLSGTGNGSRAVQLQANPYPYTGGFKVVGNEELTTSSGGFSFTLPSLALNTQFRVITPGANPVVSPTAVAYDALAVSEHAQRLHRRHGLKLRFTGHVSPNMTGAVVSVQQLTSRGWKAVGGAHTDSRSNYRATISVRHGGFFRVVAVPLDRGAYAIGYTGGSLIHAR